MESDRGLENGDYTPLLKASKGQKLGEPPLLSWVSETLNCYCSSAQLSFVEKTAGFGCLESIAYFGISTNLVVFLGDIMRQSNPSISASIMTWTGTCFMTPFLGALMADFFCGGYWIILTSSLIELLVFFSHSPSLLIQTGMILVTLSSTFRPCTTSQRAVFFSGLYMVAVGSGGVKSSLLPLGADQFSEEDQTGRTKKASFFNWFFFSLNLGSLFSSTILVWAQENIGWTVGFSFAAAAMAAAIVTFLSGTKFYKPRTTTAHLTKNSTKFQAEETKFLLRLLPIWFTGIVFSGVYAHMYTTFVLQGKAMNVRISSFSLPPASLLGFEVVSVMLWLVLCRAIPLPSSALVRIGIGNSLLAAAMAAAAAVEMKRVKREKNLMFIAWQLPQYFLVGGAEALGCVGQVELFYGEAPEKMRSVATAVALVGFSLGNYLSSAAMAGMGSWWVPGDLALGSLGYLFSALSGVCLLNLLFFSAFARRFHLRNYLRPSSV
ncbi:protein NRT1/ PTR FAMILY 8.3-like [Wolffia australiana]